MAAVPLELSKPCASPSASWMTTPLNFRADAALSYARAGAHRDAERLIREYDRATAGRHVSPGLAAMARLAVRDYAKARALLEQAMDIRASGTDPMPLLLIRRNSWVDPVLEQPEWRSLRERLGDANWNVAAGAALHDESLEQRFARIKPGDRPRMSR